MKKYLLYALVILLFLTSYSFALSASDFIQVIENTDQCLIDCHAVVKVRNPTLFGINVNENNLNFDFSSAVNFKIKRLETISYDQTVYTRACNPYAVTSANGTITIDNCTYAESKQTKSRQQYIDFLPSGTLPSGSEWLIRIDAKKQIGENIKWGLHFNGYYLDPWWNDSWIHNKPIRINNTNDTVTLVGGHPVRITINMSNLTLTRNDCQDLRFVYNNQTEMEWRIVNTCNSTIVATFDFRLAGNISPLGSGGNYNVYYNNPDATYTSRNITTINGTAVVSSTKALWHANENAGSTVYDNTTNGNNGTLAGVSWIPRYLDYGLQFDASGDNMNAPDANSLDISGDFTVEFWLNTSSIGACCANILSKSVSGGVWNYEIIHVPSCTSGASSCVRGSIRDGTSSSVDSVKSLNDSKWHHVAFIRNTTADQIQFWIDGRFDSATTDTTTGSITNAQAVRLGDNSGAGRESSFSGEIDAIRISDKALSTAEMGVLKPEPIVTLGAEDKKPPCNGTISVQLLSPAANTELQRGQNFTIKANITCTSGCCGTVTADADPAPVEEVGSAARGVTTTGEIINIIFVLTLISIPVTAIMLKRKGVI